MTLHELQRLHVSKLPVLPQALALNSRPTSAVKEARRLASDFGDMQTFWPCSFGNSSLHLDAQNLVILHTEALSETWSAHEVVHLIQLDISPLHLTHDLGHVHGHVSGLWSSATWPRQPELLCSVTKSFLKQAHHLFCCWRGMVDVAAELLTQLLSNLMLLALREGLKHHGNGVVQILRQNVLPQLHPGICLCHADNAFDVTCRHGRSATFERLSTDKFVEVCKFLLVNACDLGENMFPCKDNVILQELLVDWLNMRRLECNLWLNQPIVAIGFRMRADMAADHMVSQLLILLGVCFIAQNTQH